MRTYFRTLPAMFPITRRFCLLDHAEVDILRQMHLDGGAHYFVYGSPLFGCHQNWFFAMSNGFDMSSNDQHILHYLFPQGKFVPIQLSEINSCTKCWSHVPFEKLYFYWPSPKTSFNFLCCFVVVEQQVALIPLVGYGVLDVCGSMWGLVWYVHIKQHREYDRRKWLKRRHNSSSHYYVTLNALLPLD